MVWVRLAIRWWSRGLLLVAGSFLLISCGTVAPAQVCTLVGCNGGISIDIAGLPQNTNYEVSLILPSGERITQVCDEAPEVSFKRSCTESGAFIALAPDDLPPDTVTIEVVMDGKTYTHEFKPDYEKYQPNGEDCPPICYNATINFQLTE